jgi:plasmid maintenance system antidote protein VapI
MAGSSKRRRTMSEVLKNEIAKSGEAIAAIARAASVPQPILHRFVKGEQGLTLRNAEKLAAYFDLELRKRTR